MRRLVSLTLLLAAASAPAIPQSLGEVAERTNKQRKGTPAKVYTNDDLSEAHSGPEKLAAPVSAAPAASASAAPAPAPTMDPAQRWRRDAKARRDAITRAEARVAAIQARLDALLIDRDPMNVGDPNRLQTLEAERAKGMQELETSKAELAKAHQDLEDLEEEARKSGVPPGWLREP
jgi:hypothetical protein